MTDKVLPAVEVLDRQTLEATVRANEGAAREWVLALLQLHDRKLYRETFSSWDAYVLETFGYSHSTATRWLAQGREILALEAAPEDKAAGQDRPRRGLLPSQRESVKAQQTRRNPIPAASHDAPSKKSEGVDAGSAPGIDSPTASDPFPEPSPVAPQGVDDAGGSGNTPATPDEPPQSSGVAAIDPHRALLDALAATVGTLRAYSGPFRLALENDVRTAAIELGISPASLLRKSDPALPSQGSAKPPQTRRQGTISRPADREPVPEPGNCSHPKERVKKLAYGNFCELCKTKVA